MTGRVFITGDKHGSMRMFFDIAEKGLAAPEDTVMIAGDTGYIRDHEYPLKLLTLQRLFPGTVCFIDGNHDNHVILNSLPVCEWNGGRAHRLADRVYHLMRGEIFDIGGRRIFTMGGARTVENNYEGEEGVDFWPGEEPTAEELRAAEEKLLSNIGRIDYVISHEAPLEARNSIPRFKKLDGDYVLPAVLQSWYDRLSESPDFKKWYFGHMHTDQEIGQKLRCVYNNLIDLDSGLAIRWH